MKLPFLLLAAVCCGLLSSCGGGQVYEGREYADGQLRIALRAEPSGLNPILTTQANSRYVSEQIFQTLNARDPESLELVPFLASLPRREELPDGRISFRYELDTAARWPNGQAVTVDDVIFSMKVLLHPLIEAGPYRSYFGMVDDVERVGDNPRAFRFITRYPYMLAGEVIGDLYIYPAYIYDPEGVMRDVPLTTFINSSAILERLDRDERLRRYAAFFSDPRRAYSPGQVVGSGPYELVSWEDGQRIELRKRPDYWAAGRPEAWLRAEPPALIFLIIPDPTTLVNALRDEAVDVVVGLPIDKYRKLAEDDYLTARYRFDAIPGFQYVSILLNQEDPLLSDPRVRRALAHIVDVDAVIDRFLPHLAERIVGPVLPIKPYYNDALPALSYDLEEARRLLGEAGWTDTDGDGTLDKTVNGERLDFRFTLLSYPTTMSTSVGLMMAEEARKVGVEIEVVRREPRALMDQLSSGNFTASFYGQGFDPTLDDFTQVWSSDAVPPMGTNRGNFRNAEADSLIERITRTVNAEDRRPLYHRFQEIVYANQPMIFLYAPYDRVVVSRRLAYQLIPTAPNLLFNAITIQQDTAPPLIK
jgi:peptide/nickel transport system substrate-binding protein